MLASQYPRNSPSKGASRIYVDLRATDTTTPGSPFQHVRAHARDGAAWVVAGPSKLEMFAQTFLLAGLPFALASAAALFFLLPARMLAAAERRSAIARPRVRTR